MVAESPSIRTHSCDFVYRRSSGTFTARIVAPLRALRGAFEYNAKFVRLVRHPSTMALYPEGDKLDKYPSRYVLTNLAARRAKQIKDGDSPLVATESTHPLTIALEEIADGAIQAIFRE